MKVPNLYPKLSFNGIAFVGEAPGKDEEAMGQPFIGASGKLFDQLLSRAGITRSACFIGNVSQVRPPNNVLALWDWTCDEIQGGLIALRADLEELKPTLIVCLGNTALHAIKHPDLLLKRRKEAEGFKFVYPNSIENWRGSRFLDPQGRKCMAAYHPAFCLRNFKDGVPFLQMDLNRAARESKTRELVLPQRVLDTNASPAEIIRRIHTIRRLRLPTSMDIEGNYQFLPCISICTDPAFSFIVPFCRKDGSHCWSEDDEVALTRELSRLLADPLVPKKWQNGLYDRWNLQYGHRMPCYGNQDDTMPKWWEKYCELPKSLATQVSVLTDEPYYKGDIKSQEDNVFFEYCCRDSAVTLEISNKLDALLPAHHPNALQHYRLNHDLLNVFLYIELRGMLYDREGAKRKRHTISNHIYGLQSQLDRLAGIPDLPPTPEARENLLRSICCYVRNPSLVKAEYKNSFQSLLARSNAPTLTEADRGFINSELGLSCNVKGSTYKELLYRQLALPVQRNKTTGAETTDYLALQRLAKRHPHPAVQLGIEIGLLRTRTQMLEIGADPDGRIRSSYNGVGTNTGRVTSSTSPTGSGYNLQTLPDDDHSKPTDHPLREGMRRLVMADSDHWMFQCDLRGSDGWTIGAHLAALGDSTMLDDLRFGIKPAQRIAYMLRHGNLALKKSTRPEILELLKEIKKTDWDYFACKVGIWGLCYLMGPDLLADEIFQESEGKLVKSRAEIDLFKKAVFDAYGIRRWHESMQRKLKEKPILTCGSGHTRRFYDRADDALGQALAHEPQSNTTYATNLAALRLWNDPENRTHRIVMGQGGKMVTVPFRVEPLHQVHDALIGQFRKEDAEWAIPKIREWFDNSFTVAGISITIPFEGAYGPSWGDLSVGKI